jgi:cation/acetate symporter
MKKKEKVAAEQKNAELQASVTAKTEKNVLAAKKKEAGAAMPKAIFPLKNPGIYSMAAAFLIGILVSLMTPDKVSQDKFADEKVREYIGIGAE